jgi:predicted small secreted protein
MRRIFLVAAMATVTTGCVTNSGGDTIAQISSDVSKNAFVKDITVNTPAGAGPQFEATFKKNVSEKLAGCAKGTQPLLLKVNITDFKKANAGMTILVGSSNKIKGVAQLIDPATDKVVADYEIDRSTGGGGLIAAAAMADAEGQMSSGFGTEICKRAFIAR